MARELSRALITIFFFMPNLLGKKYSFIGAMMGNIPILVVEKKGAS
jgi:hypothetical protein